MVRLRRSNVGGPGITRRRCGKGFIYVGPDGRRVTDEEVLARIRRLVVPPAWQDVWISPVANGHIQAIGTDAKGRRQYRYHDDWRVRRDAAKFDHMLAFAAVLPPLRRTVAMHIAEPEPSRDRVLAVAVRLLDDGFFRIGTEGYADQNNTFGLATLRKEHVRIDGQRLTFDYTAKSGVRRVQSVVDAEVADAVRLLKRRRGGAPELLAYRDGRRWIDVKSGDINAYLKECTGEDITAKDFRTWHATVLCAVALAEAAGTAGPAGTAMGPTARRRAVAAAIKAVAHDLGNTPAVCRASYVDPRIIDRFHAGVTIAGPVLPARTGGRPVGEHVEREVIEAAVLELLGVSLEPDAMAA